MTSPTRRPRHYWLFKSEPEVFSFDHLMRAKARRTHWDGVRNYQARNLLRDEMQKGDGVLFYHSNAKPMAIVGIATISREGYPDHTAWDPQSRYFDAKSDADAPTWYMVDIDGVAKFEPSLTRDRLKEISALDEMVLLQKGSRLSVQPVRAAEWRAILKLAGLGDHDHYSLT